MTPRETAGFQHILFLLPYAFLAERATSASDVEWVTRQLRLNLGTEAFVRLLGARHVGLPRLECNAVLL